MLIRNTSKLLSKYNLIYVPIRFMMDFDPKKDYYKILGLSANATEKEIKAAYYKMAKLHHPDLNNGKQSNEFKEMTNAYDILSDAKKKQEYDAMRSGGFGSPFGSSGNYYNDFYGKGTGDNTNTNQSYSSHTNSNNNSNRNYENMFRNRFKNSFYSSQTKWEYRDPKTGEWKSYNTSTQGNPFFKDFEDLFRKANMNGFNQNQSYYYDNNYKTNQGSRANNPNDPFKNYWERNKNYYERFNQKNEQFYNEDFNDPNRYNKTSNPFSQNPNSGNNQYDFNNFNYDYTPILLYQFLKRLFIFGGLFMLFSFMLRRRARDDFYFNGSMNPNYSYSQYPSPPGTFIPGGIPVRSVDEYDPYDPRSQIKIK